MVLAQRTGLAFFTDLRYSARTLARSPGVSLALVFTIALGIGSNAAVHGFVRGLIARDRPVPMADRIVSVFAFGGQRRPGPVSYEEFQSFRARTDIFERLGAARESQGETVLADVWSVMSVAAITPELADLLQLPLDRGVVISQPRKSRSQLGRPFITTPGKQAHSPIASVRRASTFQVGRSSRASVWTRTSCRRGTST